jgi:serine-type D-Ala-D-Ala carboxypeptidase/endopeptidase (penicillin-binding protein 4)
VVAVLLTVARFPAAFLRALCLMCGLYSVSPAWGVEPPSLAAEAQSMLGSGQGVYVEAADGAILVSQAAALPVHPASVSKVATTLALLRKLGYEHRFKTIFAADGPIHDGTLEGDLLVETDGDPYFVDENALLVAKRLRELGIERVAGTLRIRGALTFDWESDPDGMRLRQMLSGGMPPSAWAAVQTLDTASAIPSPPPIIKFDGAVGPPGVESRSERPLVLHLSQPLLSLAKSLNDYSNNIFKLFADVAGGPAAVEALARSELPQAMNSEITLGDGAGTDPSNRLSPRAAVKLLRALEAELARSGHGLIDVLPVAGIDAGTLHDRLSDPGEAGRVVGKTGTFGDYGASALIGAITTSDRGTIYFAILNHGVPVSDARRRQDRFVRALLAHYHTVPWDYVHDARPAVARATAVIVAQPIGPQ